MKQVLRDVGLIYYGTASAEALIHVVRVSQTSFSALGSAMMLMCVVATYSLGRSIMTGATQARRVGLFSSMFIVVAIAVLFSMVIKQDGLSHLVLRPKQHWLQLVFLVLGCVAIAHTYAVARLIYRAR